MLYINEPPPNKIANCGWQIRPRQRDVEEQKQTSSSATVTMSTYERIVTTTEVAAGEELFVYYGPLYQYRGYPINAASKLLRVDVDKGQVHSED